MNIIQSTCISAQNTFLTPEPAFGHLPAGSKLEAKEPPYENIPRSLLRRMGKAVRMGVGAALPLIEKNITPNGIIIGTGNGGMEDCIRFLNQIIDYDEGTLTPTNFVQSTANAIAAQAGLMSGNLGYNITHVHRGLAFENAVIDALMLLKENPKANYLLGGIDEISTYNFNIDQLGGWVKEEFPATQDIYETTSNGSLAGEGAVVFVVGNAPDKPDIKACQTLHSTHSQEVMQSLGAMVELHLPGGFADVDVLISGENGDGRFKHFYTDCEALLTNNTAIARFKHLSGEFPSASAFGLWLSGEILKHQTIPVNALKNPGSTSTFKNVLIYNNFRGQQHGFMLVGLG
ncbi:MAG: beta-ketoacyl synthase chain length factor [Cyclobacteriaceae bacterium]|nr:beta-ketoacyl synthase chain length factor [Cyclobacteriaceae bacterium]